MASFPRRKAKTPTPQAPAPEAEQAPETDAELAPETDAELAPKNNPAARRIDPDKEWF